MLVCMWMIYSLTGSTAMMGTIMAVNALPSLLFGMAAGVLVDRMDKKLEYFHPSDCWQTLTVTAAMYSYVCGMQELMGQCH